MTDSETRRPDPGDALQNQTTQRVTKRSDITPDQQRAIQVAHQLVDAGIPVFSAAPNHGNGPEFHYPNGWQHFRPRHEQVDMWQPGWALCAVMGVKADVIDVDPRNGGERGYAELVASGAMPQAYGIAQTPSGGRHYLIPRTGLAKGKPAEGVDLQAGDDRGEGRGFVFIAPTVRVAKGGPDKGRPVAYRWTREPDLDALATAERPVALVERIRAGKAPRQAPSTAVDSDDPFDSPSGIWTVAEAERVIGAQLQAVQNARNGSVNAALGGAARLLGRFVAGGYLTEQEASARLLEALERGGVHSDAWNLANRKGWTAATVIGTALANGAKEPWTVVEDRRETPEGSAETPAPGELPPPSEPLAVARELVAVNGAPGAWWRGDLYEWRGTHWTPIEDSAVERWVWLATEHAKYWGADGKGGLELKKWSPNPRKVSDVVRALSRALIQRNGEPVRALAFANGVLELDGRQLLPHSRERFNLHSLPFAYDPAATAPRWRGFLGEVLPGDEQAQDFLAEWFGYVLSGRTDQQKMASLIGKPRSGKSTITRVLAAMLGPEGVTGTDLGSIGSDFGRADLIGKSLALMGDVRWNARNAGEAVPFLLRIIGEDVMTVRRKYREDWTGRLGTRFMMTGNDTPTFSDRSGAMADRMIHVVFPVSFYGREDFGLETALRAELPGVLNWALDGLDRLNRQGRFTEPASGRGEDEAVRRASNPIAAFVDDFCVLDPGAEIDLDHLFLKWQCWCAAEGRTQDKTTRSLLSREIRSQYGLGEPRRETRNGKKVRVLRGITSTAM
jgi:putative DNA primase/helicase